MNKKNVFWVLVFSAIFFLIGCQQQNGTESNNRNRESQDVSLAPEQTYQNNCASCHGNNLEGGLGPELKSIGGKLTKEEIASIIEKGRGGMPSQPQVSPQAREKLAEWLATKK